MNLSRMQDAQSPRHLALVRGLAPDFAAAIPQPAFELPQFGTREGSLSFGWGVLVGAMLTLAAIAMMAMV